MQQKRGK